MSIKTNDYLIHYNMLIFKPKFNKNQLTKI